MAEQGSKAGRAVRHLAAERARKERKSLKQRRACIHRAMQEAEQIRRRRKKGSGEFDKIMLELGYEAKESTKTDCVLVGRQVPGDVLDKYEETS